MLRGKRTHRSVPSVTASIALSDQCLRIAWLQILAARRLDLDQRVLTTRLAVCAIVAIARGDIDLLPRVLRKRCLGVVGGVVGHCFRDSISYVVVVVT